MFDLLKRLFGRRGAKGAKASGPDVETGSLQQSIGNRGTEAAVRQAWQPAGARGAAPASLAYAEMGAQRLTPGDTSGARQWEKTARGWTDVGDKRSASPAALKLPEKYKDEDKKVGWRVWQGVDPDTTSPEEMAKRREWQEWANIVTDYWGDDERKQHTLTPTVDEEGEDEGRPVLRTAEGGLAEGWKSLYAMSPEGQIVTHRGQDQRKDSSGQEHRIHHSTPFAGGEVAHAGHLTTSKGKVAEMDDDSGHYRPGAAHTWDAFQRLKGAGVLDYESTFGGVSMVDKTGEKGVNQAEESKLTLPFFAYDQTMGNETQARRKAAMLAQLKARNDPAAESTPTASEAPGSTVAKKYGFTSLPGDDDEAPPSAEGPTEEDKYKVTDEV